jgi:4-amino-4-deoxy-L-arabinose transferase-like glycosyltransferase
LRWRRTISPISAWVFFPALFAALLLSHLTLLRLPYYWDEAGYYIPAAWDFFRTGSLIPISTLTNAHPPLPSVYLALAWKLFGFCPLVTRIAVLLAAALGLTAVWRLTMRLVGVTSVAFWTVALTALYPIWFAQSSLAHADIFAAAATLWGLVYSLPARNHRLPHKPWAAALCFAAAALCKETAIAVPLTLAAVSLWESRRAPGMKRIRLWRESAWLAACALPLAAWYAYHRCKTGFLFGNPEFLRYNAQANLDPLRILAAFGHRLLHLTAHMNLFVPVLIALAALLLAPKPEKGTGNREQGTEDRDQVTSSETGSPDTKAPYPIHSRFLRKGGKHRSSTSLFHEDDKAGCPRSGFSDLGNDEPQTLVDYDETQAGNSPRPALDPAALRRIFLLLLMNAAFFSVLGGALLTRYLLPMYPLVLLLAVSTLYRRAPWWQALAAFSAATFVLGIFIDPPYGFAPEDNLAYARVIRLHQAGIAQLEQRYPGSTVLSAWPITDALTRPELGYLSQPFAVTPIEDFSAPQIARAADEPEKFSTALVFSTKADPASPIFTLGQASKAMDERYFGLHHDLQPEQIAHQLGGTLVWKQQNQGQWIALIRFNRQFDARLASLPIISNHK